MGEEVTEGRSLVCCETGIMITWDIVFFPFTVLSYALTIFFSTSVAIGGIMVKGLVWVYQYSSLLLILFSMIWQLLLWMVGAIWLLIYAVIVGSSVVGKVLFTGMITAAQYGYYGVLLSYNVVTSMIINGWLIMKDSIWPTIIQCVIYIISMVISMMNMFYNLLTILCDHMIHIATFSVQFIQHTVGPFIVSTFHYLLYGVIVVFEHCYSIIMTVLHYITAMMLRITETLPGVVQPIASDIVYYGSDIVATVISVVFSVLRWTVTHLIDVTELLLTTPAFWAILLAAIVLSYLYYCYSRRRQHVVGRLTAAPIERREIKQERNDTLQSTTVTTAEVETDSDVMRRKEKFEEEMLCVVCQYEKKVILLQPCNHLCLCRDCVEPVLANNRICPMCRKHVQQWTKVFL